MVYLGEVWRYSVVGLLDEVKLNCVLNVFKCLLVIVLFESKGVLIFNMFFV